MDCIFIELECENRKTSASELKGYQEVINEQAQKGYEYVGHLPVLMGPSGKVLKISLIFKK